MKRRRFTQLSALSSIGLMVPLHGCKNKTNSSDASVVRASSFLNLASELLCEWCDAMLATQINAPENPELHGALFCNAMNRIHGR